MTNYLNQKVAQIMEKQPTYAPFLTTNTDCLFQAARDAVANLKENGYLTEEGVFLDFYAVPNEL